MKPIKFNSGREMYDYLVKQPMFDLYSPSHNLYVFLYNNSGSISYYDWIDEDEAKELARKSTEVGCEWSELLGPGGSICDIGMDYEELWEMDEGKEYDPNDENDAYWFCDGVYMYDDWYDTDEYGYEVLK